MIRNQPTVIGTVIQLDDAGFKVLLEQEFDRHVNGESIMIIDAIPYDDFRLGDHVLVQDVDRALVIVARRSAE